jgi:very-short-patch-repair endonuclease
MWNLLKEGKLLHSKFRRQHPISTFIADFYSHGLRLVIEIDGGYHLSRFQKEYDNFRDEDMTALGISVIRFTNDDVIRNNKMVLRKLQDRIQLLSKQVIT